MLIVEDIIDSVIRCRRSVKSTGLRERNRWRFVRCWINLLAAKWTCRFVGFSIPDEFVVGYGIDYAQRYRHLPYVGKVVLLLSKRRADGVAKRLIRL